MPRTITQFQAFLILLQLPEWSDPERDALERLSLSGIRDASKDDWVADKLNQRKALSPYTVSLNPNDITNDPARRYFETTLAYHTLEDNLDALPVELLEWLIAGIASNLSKESLAEIKKLLHLHPDQIEDPNRKQYADAILKIQQGACFAQWSDAKKEKMKLLMSLCLHCLFSSSENDRWLPLNIYDQGLFSQKNRGKEALSAQDSTRNHHYGLLKGHMPIPQDDICFSELASDFLKPSDQSTFNQKAQWPRYAFSKRVHPYSNAISGTMLCLLKHFSYHKKAYGEKSPLHDPKILRSLIQLIISLRLFIHGGHSLLEFTSVLKVPAVQHEFKDIVGFSEMDIERLFYEENETAFYKALMATIVYNETLLKRRSIQDEIIAHGGESSSDPNRFISHPEYQKQLAELKSYIRGVVLPKISQARGKQIFEHVLEKLEQHALSEAKALIEEFRKTADSVSFFKSQGTFNFLVNGVAGQIDELLNFEPTIEGEIESESACSHVSQNTHSHHSHSSQFR